MKENFTSSCTHTDALPLLLCLYIAGFLNYCIQYNMNANYIQYYYNYFSKVGNCLPKDLFISQRSLQALPLVLRMTVLDVWGLIRAIAGKLQFKFAHRA